MIDGVDMPPPARGCLSTEGTGRGSTESIMTFIFFDKYVLPQEVIEWIAAGVDFGYHLVEVSTKFVNTYLFAC